MLEDHGWIIHRVWSADWIQRPREQLERLLNALGAARLELDARLEATTAARRAVAAEIVAVERGDVVEIGLEPLRDGPQAADAVYEEATAEAASGRFELHEAPLGLLVASIVEIVRIEGPVHSDEVLARLKAAYGVQRAGARIQAHFERCIAAARGDGRIVIDGAFLTLPGREVRVRDRSAVLSQALRRPKMLPPAEMRLALVGVARANLGASPDELVQGAARAFGFRSVGACESA